MFKKVYFYIVGMIFLTAVIFSGVNILYKEWRSGYVVWNQPTYYKVNFLTMELKKIAEGLYRPIFASNEHGLPGVRLYISQQNQNALMKNMPVNTKTWQEAYRVYPEGTLRPVKVRHRGDNPVNWAYDKKSWRLKTRKKNLINRKRVFSYVAPQEANYLDNHVAYTLGRWTNVLSPESRPIEMFINEQSYGIYDEVEHLDESFLRNNNLMPVNIYKGDQNNSERKFGLDINLFNNPRLWHKTAVFNQVAEKDFSDLSYFLELLSKAETSEPAFKQLKRVARFEDWARFSAYQILVQSWHNNSTSNMRLVLDPWRGTVQPVVMDTSFGYCVGLACTEQDYEMVLDKTSHSLLSLYHSSPEFLIEKYRYLYRFVKDGVLLKMIDHIKGLLPALEKTYSRDKFRFQKLFVTEHLARPVIFPYSMKLVSDEGMKAEWNRLLKNLDHLHNWLDKQLESNPQVHWLTQDGQVSLIVGGYVPIDHVVFELTKKSLAPNKIVWDRDGDGKISKQDLLIPFHKENNSIIMEATWTANRVTGTYQSQNDLRPYGRLVPVPTQFNLLMDTPVSLRAAKAHNALTGESFLLTERKKQGNSPRHRNHPITGIPSAPTEVWSSSIEIDKVRVIDHPVKILSGTIIKMHSEASLIFRNKVLIEGTRKYPVSIRSAKPGQIWGTVAFHGSQTEGTVINHLKIENGSGAVVDNVRYIASLSVHEAKNIEFNHLHLRKNHNFDDMMHVVYSKGITLRDCRFENAYSDALDVDISSIHIHNCKISGSGNDAIDLMSSNVLVENSFISGSGDKGISVGEASEVSIINSVLKNNTIGVEAKDRSKAYLVNSNMLHNKRQLNVYSKNWHYGTGGTILASKSIFRASENRITAKKGSKINIIDSAFPSGFPEEDKQVFLDNLSDTKDSQMAASNNYNKLVKDVLSKWGITGLPSQRGVFQ
jgi:hypothetical protein